MAVVSQEAAASAETGAQTAPQLQVGGFEAPQPEIAAGYTSAEATNSFDGHSVDDEDADSNEDEGEQTFWDMLATWYLPLILLWLRRSMFGVANLIRSLLVGQAIRLLLLTQSGDIPKWAQPLTDPHAWPPPAFTALAIFTVVAFVVHPDGLTWFMLGKLRDAILSLLHSFASCWTMFIQDYGIITTTIALMTLAGIGCLLGILLKNALPSKGSSKRNYSSHADGRKKKKRKGVKGKGSRIRQFRKQPLQEGGVAEKVPDANPMDDESSSATAVHESTRVSDPNTIIEGSPTSQEEFNTRSTTPASSSTILMEETIPESEPLLESAAPSLLLDRPRMHSTDTAETMTDDLSCDSTSVRSFSSTPTAVTVGSTGNSEKSGLNSKRRNNNAASSRRKQQQNSAGSSKPLRGDRKVTPSLDSNHESKTSRRQNTSAANKSVPSNRHHPDVSRLSTKPAPTGRFANLKEKDTRFDNPRARNNHNNARIGGGGGITKGRNNVHQRNTSNNRNANQQHPPSDSYGSGAAPAKHAPAPIARSPLRPAPSNQQHFGSSVQCGSPYSPDIGSQKKQDLSSFIATVGLVSNEAAALVANVADIDSLDRLSDVQFQLYGVSGEKQAQLGKLLEQRRRRRRPAVRPPPGLSPLHDEPPTLFGSPNRPSTNVSPHFSSINPVASHFPVAMTHPFAYDEYQDPFMVDDEDSRIEAELQELGGKMIGSVLDF